MRRLGGDRSCDMAAVDPVSQIKARWRSEPVVQFRCGGGRLRLFRRAQVTRYVRRVESRGAAAVSSLSIWSGRGRWGTFLVRPGLAPLGILAVETTSSPMVPHLGLLNSYSTMSTVEVLSPKDQEIVEYLLFDLLDPENKAYAHSMLPKKRGMWYSFGTIAALLLEIGSVYPALSSPTLSASAVATAWNALGLLQTVAAHPETRTPFLEAGIPLYLLPFLNTTSEAKSFEYLRASSLGVLGALAKVATFIVQKIMLDEVGLQHICAAMECFFQAASVLASMVITLTEGPSTKLLKHIIGCYLRLTNTPRAHTALQTHLREALRDGTFDNCLRDDPAARHFLEQLLGDLSGPASGTQVVRQAQLEGPLKQAQVA